MRKGEIAWNHGCVGEICTEHLLMQRIRILLHLLSAAFVGSMAESKISEHGMIRDLS